MEGDIDFKKYLKEVWYNFIDPNIVDETPEIECALALLQALECRLIGIRSGKVKVDAVYKAYPAKCLVSGRTLAKGQKDKNKISALLSSGKYTTEDLILIIKNYISQCVLDNTYMKNFQTFLNNLPELEDVRGYEPIEMKLTTNNIDLTAEKVEILDESDIDRIYI